MRHLYLWAVEHQYSSGKLTPRDFFGTKRGAERQKEFQEFGGGSAKIQRFLVLELPEDRALSEEAIAVLKDYAQQLMG